MAMTATTPMTAMGTTGSHQRTLLDPAAHIKNGSERNVSQIRFSTHPVSMSWRCSAPGALSDKSCDTLDRRFTSWSRDPP